MGLLSVTVCCSNAQQAMQVANPLVVNSHCCATDAPQCRPSTRPCCVLCSAPADQTALTGAAVC
jgi:hypothetical protein